LAHEAVLHTANTKFEQRFRAVEQAVAERGKSPEHADLAEMDALWQKVKHHC
jgi:nucleoside triphosphate diphosphatase